MALVLLLLLPRSGVSLAEQSAARYRAPVGVNGYAWSTPLRAVSRLVHEPIYVQTAYSPGKVTGLEMQCAATATGACELERSLRTLDQRVEAEGFHLLAEYYVQSQGLRMGEGGALFYPVFYQFCASWSGATDAIPVDIQDRMKLCGARLLFQIAEEGGATTYDLVLEGLMKLHGTPDGYEGRGRVTIEPAEGTTRFAGAGAFEPRRWCGPNGASRAVAPACKASVVLDFDPESGWGVVLYATRPVWEFAHARLQGGASDDPLYVLLHGAQPREAANPACTGSRLCRPVPSRAMSAERRALFQLRGGKAGDGF